MKMSWQEEDLIHALAEFGARPGTEVPIMSVNAIWWKINGQRTKADLVEAIDGLTEKGLVEKSQHGISVTDEGYKLF